MSWDVEVVQVVRTRLTSRGKGTQEDPVRRIEQYWTLDGTLLAEVDPATPEGMRLEQVRNWSGAA